MIPNWAKLKNYKIKQKLLLTYPPLIALSILVVSAFAIMLSIELFREKAITYSQNILRQISYNIDTQLSRIDQDTVIFYQNHDVTEFFSAGSGYSSDSSAYFQTARKIREFLTNFLISHQNVESIYLINNLGEVVSTSDTLDKEQSPLYYHERAVEGDGRIVWLATKTSSIGNRVIPAVREIFDTSTLNRNGTILLHLKESAVSDLLEKEYVGNNVTMVLIDRDGNVVSSKDKDQLGTQIDAGIAGLIEQSDLPEGYFFRVGQGARAYYNFYKSEFTHWTYLYRIPSQDLFAGYENIQRCSAGC